MIKQILLTLLSFVWVYIAARMVARAVLRTIKEYKEDQYGQEKEKQEKED